MAMYSLADFHLPADFAAGSETPSSFASAINSLLALECSVTILLPNFFTSAFWPFCAANLPASTSIMPPLAAFIMKFLSAALSLLAALAAPFAGIGVAFGASALAPVFNGG